MLSFLGSLCLYAFSLAPSVQGFDSAELSVGAYALGFVHPPGYPLYMLLGRLFSLLPVGEVGLRLNLMSALFASLAAALLFVLAYQGTGSAWAASLATVLLATAPAYWSQAIRAEVYALHILLVCGALLAWRQAQRSGSARSRLLVFLLLGLGMGNHTTSALLWLAVLACTRWREPRSRWLSLWGSLLGLALAASLYLYFPLRASANPPIDYIQPYFGVDLSSLQGLWWLVSGQAFRCLLIPAPGSLPLLSEAPSLADFLWQGTLGFGLLLAAWGWRALRASQPDWNRLLSAYFLANLLAFLAYRAVDKQVIFLPILAATSIWAASGFRALAAWLADNRPQARPKSIEAALGAALLLAAAAGAALDWPSVSLRGERRTYQFARQTLAQVGPATTIVNHWATASVFDYLRLVEGQRPDVESFNLDFYFLAIQRDCQPVETSQLLENGWIERLEDLSSQGRLCFIEPLHELPAGYRWRQNGACWDLAAQGP